MLKQVSNKIASLAKSLPVRRRAGTLADPDQEGPVPVSGQTGSVPFQGKSGSVPAPRQTDTVPAARPAEFSVAKVERFDALDIVRNRDAQLRQAYLSSRPAVWTGIGILGGFFACIVFWVICVPLRADIHAPGEIVFKTKRQSVQHLEGGIVKQILVHDGDTVTSGQPLIILESNQVAPLVNMMEEQSYAEMASAARVEAESKDLSSIRFPSALTSRANEPNIAKIMQTETRLFEARRVAFQHQVELLRLQIAEIKASTKGTRERLNSKNQELASLKEQLDANVSLQKQGYVTHTMVLDLQRSLANQSGEREVLLASIASEKERVAEYEQRILSLRAERVNGAVNELKQSGLRRIDQQERVRPLRDTLDRQVIRAPVAGKVVGLKVSTVGGIIQPRESLMEIAPSGDNLIVEAKVPLDDISEVKVGQVADVNISGLHLIVRPQVKARVTYVSDDRLVSPASQQGPAGYYAAQLEFDQKSLKTLGGVELKPGMTVHVSIGTKPRTPFSDMMVSVHEKFNKALSTR
jgi:HlyD family type I secretion membrane fusion protein